MSIEALLIAPGSAATSSRFLTRTPADLATAGPIVRVLRLGGPSSDDLARFDAPTLSFECFAAGEQAASDLASAVDRWVRSLPGTTLADGTVVTKAQTVSGPAWRPYADTTVSQYGCSHVLHVMYPS
jgi:hypothetical protein